NRDRFPWSRSYGGLSGVWRCGREYAGTYLPGGGQALDSPPSEAGNGESDASEAGGTGGKGTGILRENTGEKQEKRHHDRSLELKKPFKIFTETGFPPELIAELEKRTGHKIIGNKSASGTEILDELGEEEIATGHMIVYTSADSVLQICGNEETFGLDELYRCCESARQITMKDEWRVGRVIARPYVGKKKGEFRRTSNRHDYALKPFGPTVLNVLKEA